MDAGKTTLFNRLTNETAVASDALFVTLDPLVRQVSLPDKRRLLLSREQKPEYPETLFK